MIKIGFIGTGNMAQAILKGVISSQLTDNSNIYVNNRSQAKILKLVDEYGVTNMSQEDIFKQSDVIILGVKPDSIREVLEINKEHYNENSLIISIAAGVSLTQMFNVVPSAKIVRVMPNTPALVQEAMSAICFGNNISSEEKNTVIRIFDSIGKTEIVDEKLMSAVIGVSGSSPAYIYVLIEALADGAVKCGLSREQAYEMAAQAVYGSAKMVLESGIHPAELKDMVCSPGGTTIAAVHSLEKDGFRNSLINAVETAALKNDEMTNE